MKSQVLNPAVHREQQILHARADRTADAAERVVRRVWLQLLDAIKSGHKRPHDWMGNYHRIAAALQSLLPDLVHEIAGDLHALTRQAHVVTARGLVKRLPKRSLELAVRRRQRQPLAPILEAEDEFDFGAAFGSFDKITVEDLFRQLVLPLPTAEQVNQIIYAGDWTARLGVLSKLATPEVLASIVATGLQQGKTPQQIAKEILPQVQGVQASARRVARTEGVRVGHETQMQAWDQLGDQVIGYQIHHTPNMHTRKWHKDRDGTIYYKDPEPGQKGLFQMPRPPMEAPDPAERPAGAPQIAPNCLCWLTPVLTSSRQKSV